MWLYLFKRERLIQNFYLLWHLGLIYTCTCMQPCICISLKIEKNESHSWYANGSFELCIASSVNFFSEMDENDSLVTGDGQQPFIDDSLYASGSPQAASTVARTKWLV